MLHTKWHFIPAVPSAVGIRRCQVSMPCDWHGYTSSVHGAPSSDLCKGVSVLCIFDNHVGAFNQCKVACNISKKITRRAYVFVPDPWSFSELVKLMVQGRFKYTTSFNVLLTGPAVLSIFKMYNLHKVNHYEKCPLSQRVLPLRTRTLLHA